GGQGGGPGVGHRAARPPRRRPQRSYELQEQGAAHLRTGRGRFGGSLVGPSSTRRGLSSSSRQRFRQPGSSKPLSLSVGTVAAHEHPIQAAMLAVMIVESGSMQ